MADTPGHDKAEQHQRSGGPHPAPGDGRAPETERPELERRELERQALERQAQERQAQEREQLAAYELDEDEASPPRGTDARHREPPAPANKPSLLEGFDPDADFERDPELARAAKVGGAPPERRGGDRRFRDASERPRREAAPADRDERSESGGEGIIARPGVPNAQISAAIGLGVMLSAMIVAGVNARASIAAHVIVAGYQVLLHAATGVVAIYLVAKFHRLKLGAVELAAARMLLAVALFQLCFQLNFRLFSGKFEEVLAAAGAYFLATLLLFRQGSERTLHVGATHFVLWLLVWLGSMLQVWVATSEPPEASSSSVSTPALQPEAQLPSTNP
ncbi:MAG: hypothetical protein SFZ23_16170 [Planctomycetota bacterium]|nr:hypothetical protein [Planctomycetota bacterium]